MNLSPFELDMSSPEGVISASPGTFFYREGNDQFYLITGAGSTAIYISKRGFITNPWTVGVPEAYITFSTAFELWKKTSGTGKTGWTHISNQSPNTVVKYADADAQPLPTPPTPTPTVTPTPTPTPTPTATGRPSPWASSVFSQSRADSINAVWAMVSGSNLAPSKTVANFGIINSYTSTSASWNTNFWGYANRNVLDFSGMPYDTMQQATLITPQHYISDTHFAPPATVTYYDYNTGAAVTMSIADRIDIPGTDMEIGVFTQPVPSNAAVAVYPIAILSASLGLQQYTFPVIYTAGRYISSYDTLAFIGANGYNLTATTASSVLADVAVYNSLPYVDRIFSSTDFSAGGLAGGDSSNPAFLVMNNKLALFLTFWYSNGQGPMWGNPYNLTAINNAISTLGSHGFSASMIDMVTGKPV